jgi:hypothetical protein
MKSKDKFVCSGCGSENIKIQAWVNPNDNNSFVKYVDDHENSFCYDCYCLTTEVKHKKSNHYVGNN